MNTSIAPTQAAPRYPDHARTSDEVTRLLSHVRGQAGALAYLRTRRDTVGWSTAPDFRLVPTTVLGSTVPTMDRGWDIHALYLYWVEEVFLQAAERAVDPSAEARLADALGHVERLVATHDLEPELPDLVRADAWIE